MYEINNIIIIIKPLLVFYFRVEEKFAGGKFCAISFAVDIIFAGAKFRAKSKFAKIAKIDSTRKIGVIQYTVIILFSLNMIIYVAVHKLLFANLSRSSR